MTRSLLVVSHNFPRFAGDPAGAFVERLASQATGAGWRVRVLAPTAPGTARRESRDGLEIVRFSYPFHGIAPVAYRGDLHVAARNRPAVALALPGFLLAFAATFRRLVEQERPDVVHAHWWLPGGWVATRWPGPVVITCHGSDVRLLDRSLVLRRWGHRVLGRARAVTTVSDYLRRDLIGHFPDLAEKVATRYLPVDDRAFSPSTGSPPAEASPVILYAGNLIATKGIDTLLRAVARLRTAGVPCRLRILGEGPAGDDLRRLAGELHLADVEWSTFVDQARMAEEYRAAAVTVLPSTGGREGLGLTLVEAQLAGCAVVGSATGGIPEVVVDGESGLLVPPGDPERLAEALRRLIGDPILRERLAQEGRRRALDRFGLQSASRPFLQLYENVRAD